MLFVLLSLTSVVYLLRPADWIPGLDYNWNLIFSLLSFPFIFARLANRDLSLKDNTVLKYFVGFVLAIPISNIANLQLSSVGKNLSIILATFVIYLLVTLAIKDKRLFERYMLLLILTILFICYQCYQQVTVGYNWGGLEPQIRLLADGSEGYQVIWYGVFSDPNDLGLLLVSVFPYSLNRAIQQKKMSLKFIFWLGALLVIAYTIHLTNSRGTLLAMIGAVGSYIIVRRRSVKGLILSVLLGIVMMAFGPSRMSEIGSGDDSAMDRVFAWILAIKLFAFNPLFGIGSGHFIDHHHLTTHNSFVLAFVETGFVGFICYFSMFLIALGSAVKLAYELDNKNESNEIMWLTSGLVGVCISIFFISRTYILIPFLNIALLTCYLKFTNRDLLKSILAKFTFIKMGFLSASFIFFIYLFNRVATIVLL